MRNTFLQFYEGRGIFTLLSRHRVGACCHALRDVVRRRQSRRLLHRPRPVCRTDIRTYRASGRVAAGITAEASNLAINPVDA